MQVRSKFFNKDALTLYRNLGYKVSDQGSQKTSSVLKSPLLGPCIQSQAPRPSYSNVQSTLDDSPCD